MTSSQAEAAANWLHEEHVQRRAFKGIEPWPSQPDEVYAYAVQDGLLSRRLADGEAIAGYKIGLTTPIMQTLCHGDRPISGVMPARTLRPAPALVRTGDFVRLGIESELAVRIATPLPRKPAPLTRDDIAASVVEIAAAFELIEDRGADYDTLQWLWMAADNSWHMGLVVGRSVPVRDLSDLKGTLRIDGKVDSAGSTRDVLGHPFDAVAWLANHLRTRGRELEPGQWISTGSIVPIRHAKPGQHYHFTIAGLPPVEISVAR